MCAFADFSFEKIPFRFRETVWTQQLNTAAAGQFFQQENIRSHSQQNRQGVQ